MAFSCSLSLSHFSLLSLSVIFWIDFVFSTTSSFEVSAMQRNKEEHRKLGFCHLKGKTKGNLKTSVLRVEHAISKILLLLALLRGD